MRPSAPLLVRATSQAMCRPVSVMKLFVGLGNPGAKYALNRHNVGFMAVDRIADRGGFGPWRKKFQGLACEGELAGERVQMLKPTTYMNECGRAVGEAARYLKIAEADIVVFHDELDLAPGKVRVKFGGGNAGHNGLRSISSHIGNDYARVRIGIDHPGVKELVQRWVLNDFARADNAWLDPLLDAIADSAPRLAGGDHGRFLTDVARVMQDLEPSDDEGAEQSPATAKGPARRAGNAGHPAGERWAKRQTALAENLRKWLTSKRPPGSNDNA